MSKWYDDDKLDNNIIISSRIRLARNMKKYPFALTLTNEKASEMINEAVSSIKKDSIPISTRFEFIDMEKKSDIEKYSMLNRHIVSPEFLKINKPKGLLLEEDETISIMINEEDHIRMQAIFPGDNIDKAWERINEVDNIIEDTVEYAFDKDFGYLTSCPTNTGTGLRASYMIHIPILERTGQFKNIVSAIGKFGMTVRGIYGEGTESMGSIYQISNQVTIGKSEQEIIKSLKSVTNQIIEKEQLLRTKILSEQTYELEDIIYRAYGILTNCRKISGKEAISLLSEVRLGYMLNVLKVPKPKNNIFSIMMNIQPGALQQNYGRVINETERDILRAEYIRTALSQINEEG